MRKEPEGVGFEGDVWSMAGVERERARWTLGGSGISWGVLGEEEGVLGETVWRG